MSEYLPIASYGVVGNQETCALVGQNGSIDWLPLPYVDSESVFAEILDAERGGRFQLCPTEFDESHQRYVDGTAVLETTFETNDATLTVTDFLPPVADDEDHLHRTLYRQVTCDGGPMRVEVEFQPRFDYARAQTELAAVDGGLVATGHHDWVFLSTDTPLEVEDGIARTVFSMEDDESQWFAVRYDSQSPISEAACERRLAETVEHWRDWTHDCAGGDECPFGGQWHGLAVRSGIVLNMLAARETGAIAAAPTTSILRVSAASATGTTGSTGLATAPRSRRCCTRSDTPTSAKTTTTGLWTCARSTIRGTYNRFRASTATPISRRKN